MGKSRRFLLIVMIILIIFSMSGCGTKKDGTTSTIEEIDTPKEKIDQIDISNMVDWKIIFQK